MATHGARNRSVGHNLERLVVNMLKAIGYNHAVTSRSESKNRDDSGVDIMNHNEIDNGRLPYNIQCKCSTDRPQYDKILSEMPKHKGVKNVIIHKYTIKQGTLFNPRGHFAILSMGDFLDMVANLRMYRERENKKEDPNDSID